MTNPIPTFYHDLSATLMERIDELITEEIQERLADDPDFPDHADDEEGEAYIMKVTDFVYQGLKLRMTPGNH